jgi:integrase
MGRIFRRGKTWTWRAEFGRDPVNGQRLQPTKGGFKTKAEAQVALRKAEHEFATGTQLETDKLTVADFLRRWLIDHAAIRVTPRTLESYQQECEKHLIPKLGAVKLAELRPLHLQRYYGQALTSGRLDGKGGLSATTVRYHHRLLHEALEQAVRWQLAYRNVADAASPPPAPKVKEPDLEAEQCLRLMTESAGTWLFVPVLLAIGTGMRRGEIAALMWMDVDFDRSVITVRQSLEETRSIGLRFKTPKSEKTRKLLVDPVTLAVLRQWRADQAQERLLLADRGQNLGLVVCHSTGEPYLPGSITHAFTRLRNRLGLSLRFHDLRHFQGTYLANKNIHIAIIQERLGHADMNTTRRYVHVNPEMQNPAAKEMAELLKGWTLPAEEAGWGAAGAE